MPSQILIKKKNHKNDKCALEPKYHQIFPDEKKSLKKYKYLKQCANAQNLHNREVLVYYYRKGAIFCIQSDLRA